MIFLIFVLFLDFSLWQIIPYSYNNLSYFTPMIFISFIPIMYYLFSKKSFFIILIVIGFLYDVFYSSFIFLNVLVLIVIGLIIHLLNRNRKVFNLFLSFILCVFLYDFLVLLLLNLLGFSFMDINDFFYKFSHSLILNYLFFLIFIFVYKGRIFGYNKKLKY